MTENLNRSMIEDTNIFSFYNNIHNLAKLRKRSLDTTNKQKILQMLVKCGNNVDEGNKILIDKYNVDFLNIKWKCLKPKTWLNDEVINFYMSMLQFKDDLSCKILQKQQQKQQQQHNKNQQQKIELVSRRSSHYFNTFFIGK
jgi:Ulp1 family protease